MKKWKQLLILTLKRWSLSIESPELEDEHDSKLIEEEVDVEESPMLFDGIELSKKHESYD